MFNQSNTREVEIIYDMLKHAEGIEYILMAGGMADSQGNPT
jgi:hypothetical protein